MSTVPYKFAFLTNANHLGSTNLWEKGQPESPNQRKLIVIGWPTVVHQVWVVIFFNWLSAPPIFKGSHMNFAHFPVGPRLKMCLEWTQSRWLFYAKMENAAANMLWDLFASAREAQDWRLARLHTQCLLCTSMYVNVYINADKRVHEALTEMICTDA